MKRAALALPLLLALSGCRGSGQVKPLDPGPSGAEYEKVKERAAAAHGDKAPRQPGMKVSPGVPAAPAKVEGPTAAPEAESASKVLDKDPAGCTWIESEGLVTAGEHDSRHQVKASAVAEARKAAMRDFLGVDVQSRFMDFQQEGLRDQQRLTEDILKTTRSGRILKERLVTEGYRDIADCKGCRFHVVLRTCLIAAEAADKDFQAELSLSQVRFMQGDKAELTVTTTRDAYLYLYDVGMDWQTWMVVPSDDVPEIFVKAGQEWRYPNAKGQSLVAEMPDDRTEVSAETIRVLASKTALPRRVWDPKDGGYLGVLQRVHAGRGDWAEDAQAFTIFRKK